MSIKSNWIQFLAESYLLAFSENDWKEGLLQLLEIIDITKLPSTESIASIFKSLGRLSLDSLAEKILSAFKICGMGLTLKFDANKCSIMS